MYPQYVYTCCTIIDLGQRDIYIIYDKSYIYIIYENLKKLV